MLAWTMHFLKKILRKIPSVSQWPLISEFLIYLHDFYFLFSGTNRTTAPNIQQRSIHSKTVSVFSGVTFQQM